MGLANAGGGYIVIGFKEDAKKKLHPDPALDGPVAQSYETTRLCQSVDSFMAGGQRIELQVYKIELKNRLYPVVSIQEFKVSPFFCGKDFLGSKGQLILKEGAIYIRDQAAKTTVIAGPVHWNQLLKVAVLQKQEEFLQQLRLLLGDMGLTLPALKAQRKAHPLNEVHQWIERERKRVKQEMDEFK